MKKKIMKFVKENKLDFKGSGSNLNGNCVILVGYVLYLEKENDKLLGENREEELNFPEIIKAAGVSITQLNYAELRAELERVYDFAYSNNYGEYWYTVDAKKRYKF